MDLEKAFDFHLNKLLKDIEVITTTPHPADSDARAALVSLRDQAEMLEWMANTAGDQKRCEAAGEVAREASLAIEGL